MAIKGVLVDVDVLVLTGANRPTESWPILEAGLRERGLVIGLMTSESAQRATARLTLAAISFDSLHSTQQTGKEKPGGSLVESFCRTHDFTPNEILVLAKDERSVLEALNGRSLGFHARGAGKSRYGIPVDNVAEFFEYMDIFFRKQHLWYARYDGADDKGRAVHVRALIDGNGAGSTSLKQLIYRTLKGRTDESYNGISLSKFLVLHLIASAYLDGFFSIDRKQVYWQIYPGHSPESVAPPLISAVLRGLTLFRSNMASLKRRSTAQRSHTSRMKGTTADINLANQLRTIILGRSANVYGRRVLVLDDFTTEGYSHEAARALFHAAGATDVVSFAVGKYGSRYSIYSPVSKNARHLDPYSANNLADEDFSSRVQQLSIDPAALDEFRTSVDALTNAQIKDRLYPE